MRRQATEALEQLGEAVNPLLRAALRERRSLESRRRIERFLEHYQGWTPERLAEIFPGTLKHHLVPLETSGQYFNYDPLV